MRYARPPETELTGFSVYDLDQDPGETRGLSAERAGKAKELPGDLEAWTARLPVGGATAATMGP